jgi:glucose-6-phosphate isomerase
VSDQRQLAERIIERVPGAIPGETWQRATGWVGHLAEDFENRVSSWDDAVADMPRNLIVLGMGGSSAGVGLYAEIFGSAQVTILDTSFPDDIVDVDFSTATVIASSKSGTTVETIWALAWALSNGLTADRLVVITDPGTPLAELGLSLGARTFYGDPHTGGRFSAFSAFGIVPALLMGWTREQILSWKRPSREFAVDSAVDGLRCADGVTDGTYMLCGDPLASYTALWEEQLVAESTGKLGRGFVPVAGPRTPLPDEPLLFVAQRFWWTVGASAGLDVDPFDQPNVELAKRNVFGLLSRAEPPAQLAGHVDITDASDVTLQMFGPLARSSELAALRDALTAGRRRVTAGIGPRFLHSSGQLHKGGPSGSVYVQIVVAPRTEPQRIAGRRFSFHDLVRAQADADAAALVHAGRDVRRVHVSESASLASVLAS